MIKKNMLSSIILSVSMMAGMLAQAKEIGMEDIPERREINISKEVLQDIIQPNANKAGLQDLIDGNGMDAFGMDEPASEQTSGGLYTLNEVEIEIEPFIYDAGRSEDVQIYQDEHISMEIPEVWTPEETENGGVYWNLEPDTQGLYFAFSHINLLEVLGMDDQGLSLEVIDYMLDSKDVMALILDVQNPELIETYDINGVTYYRADSFLDETEYSDLIDLVSVKGGYLHQYTFYLFYDGMNDPTVQQILNSISYVN